MEVNGVPIVDPKPGSTTGAVTLAENFDTFLTLLTTQLQNQDPLSPLDTTEFTNQLTSFAQVEQAINTNSKLDRLIDLQGITDLTTGVGYIGMVAEANGDKMILENGEGQIGYSLDVESARTVITIVNEFGIPSPLDRRQHQPGPPRLQVGWHRRGRQRAERRCLQHPGQRLRRRRQSSRHLDHHLRHRDRCRSRRRRGDTGHGQPERRTGRGPLGAGTRTRR